MWAASAFSAKFSVCLFCVGLGFCLFIFQNSSYLCFLRTFLLILPTHPEFRYPFSTALSFLGFSFFNFQPPWLAQCSSSNSSSQCDCNFLLEPSLKCPSTPYRQGMLSDKKLDKLDFNQCDFLLLQVKSPIVSANFHHFPLPSSS